MNPGKFDEHLTVVTERLVLRPFGPGDARQIRSVVAAGEAFLPPGAPGHVASVDQWLSFGVHELWRSGQGIHLAMTAREADGAAGEADEATIVGAISLFRTAWGLGSTEVGYGVRPRYRGRGYATEATIGLTRWALRSGGLRRVELRAHPDNLASLRVAEKAGFVREGVLREASLAADGPRDLVIFGLLRQDLP